MLRLLREPPETLLMLPPFLLKPLRVLLPMQLYNLTLMLKPLPE